MYKMPVIVKRYMDSQGDCHNTLREAIVSDLRYFVSDNLIFDCNVDEYADLVASFIERHADKIHGILEEINKETPVASVEDDH